MRRHNDTPLIRICCRTCSHYVSDAMECGYDDDLRQKDDYCDSWESDSDKVRQAINTFEGQERSYFDEDD